MSRTSHVDNVAESEINDNLPASASQFIKRGTPAFIQVTLALFSAGLTTFALLYCVQPILPILSHQFGITAAASSVSLSVSTIMLAVGLLFTGLYPMPLAVNR